MSYRTPHHVSIDAGKASTSLKHDPRSPCLRSAVAPKGGKGENISLRGKAETKGGGGLPQPRTYTQCRWNIDLWFTLFFDTSCASNILVNTTGGYTK